MTYLTREELTQVLGLLTIVNDWDTLTDLPAALGVEVKFFDANGEDAGKIDIVGTGEYGFVPHQDGED